MNKFAKFKLVSSTGLALFAMFFGAGNMVFPMQIGVFSGIHLALSYLGFVLSGVIVPFMGVFAVALYEGDYKQFFNRIGKVPAFIVITFLIFIIGPLFAAPRTEVITYHTLQPILPAGLDHPLLFDALYFFIIFLITYKQSSIVDIIAWFFSPVKITLFSILICIGAYTGFPLLNTSLTTHQCFFNAVSIGYGTMDLFGAFFFCSVVYKNIVSKSQQLGGFSKPEIVRAMLIACIIGGGLISSIYLGFMYIAATHAASLQAIPTEALIINISDIVLGRFGAFFVTICVTIACLATCSTLAEVAADYLHEKLFCYKLPRIICLLAVIGTMSLMAILGFDGIMKLASPILDVLYPLLIVLCLLNIGLKMPLLSRQ